MFKLISVLIAAGLTASCATATQNTITVADEDFGVHVTLDENTGSVEKIYLEGPQGVALGADWKIYNGVTVDGRQWVAIYRDND